MSALKNIFNLETDVFPWVYTLLVAFILAFYLGASAYFREDVDSLIIEASRSRFAVQNPDLRSLSLSDGRVVFEFDWRHHLTLQPASGSKRRVLPESYSVESDGVVVQFAHGVDIQFKSEDNVFTITTDMPLGGSMSLPWKISNSYKLVRENPGYSYLTKEDSDDPLFEVYSSSGQTEINKSKLVFYGQDSVIIRPFGAGKATLDEWLARDVHGKTGEDTIYAQLRQKYFDMLLESLTSKLKISNTLSMLEEQSLIALTLLTNSPFTFEPLIEKIRAMATLDFSVAGFTGDLAQTMPSYADYVRTESALISAAVRNKDRQIFQERDLADFLVNHSLTRAHQALVSLAAGRINTLSIPTVVNQLVFLVDSQRIRRTSGKETIIAQHLDLLLPRIFGVYQGLYLMSEASEEQEIFMPLPAIQLGRALLILDKLGFEAGQYAGQYRKIGLKLLETGVSLFSTLGRIPASMILDNGVANYSEDSVTLEVLSFIIEPRYQTREHTQPGEIARSRYILSAADNVILDSQNTIYNISMEWPAGITQSFVVFGLPRVDKVLVNGGELKKASNTQLASNEWFFNTQNKLLFVKVKKSTNNLNISVDMTVPVVEEKTPVAKPVAPARPAVQEEVAKVEPKEEVEEKELTPEEKKKLERQKREEEKRRQEEKKREEERRRQEEKKLQEEKKREEQRKKEEEKKQQNKKD